MVKFNIIIFLIFFISYDKMIKFNPYNNLGWSSKGNLLYEL